MSVSILRVHEKDNKDYSEKDMPLCPICGAKPYISKGIVDGFYFGWSVGCPRFYLNDGIHGITEETPRHLLLCRFHLNSKEECIKAWLEIVAEHERVRE